jgi:hypothetical protein
MTGKFIVLDTVSTWKTLHEIEHHATGHICLNMARKAVSNVLDHMISNTRSTSSDICRSDNTVSKRVPKKWSNSATFWQHVRFATRDHFASLDLPPHDADRSEHIHA